MKHILSVWDTNKNISFWSKLLNISYQSLYNNFIRNNKKSFEEYVLWNHKSEYIRWRRKVAVEKDFRGSYLAHDLFPLIKVHFSWIEPDCFWEPFDGDGLHFKNKQTKEVYFIGRNVIENGNLYDFLKSIKPELPQSALRESRTDK